MSGTSATDRERHEFPLRDVGDTPDRDVAGAPPLSRDPFDDLVSIRSFALLEEARVHAFGAAGASEIHLEYCVAACGELPVVRVEHAEAAVAVLQIRDIREDRRVGARCLREIQVPAQPNAVRHSR